MTLMYEESMFSLLDGITVPKHIPAISILNTNRTDRKHRTEEEESRNNELIIICTNDQ